MGVISMVATGLIKKISTDHPAIHLRPEGNFLWLPRESAIAYDPKGDAVYLLHELGHALLGHDSYTRDIELLSIERDAWTYAAQHLSDTYAVPITPETIEDALDSYREWLHARSTCPSCHLTGVQSASQAYRCVSCGTTWRVNEAKGCQLRRYPTK